MTASIAALRELAEIVSVSPRTKEARPLYVKLAHYEHGAFLNPLLFGFPIVPTTGETVSIPQLPNRPPQGSVTRLIGPDVATEEMPSVHAIVANHPVGKQLEIALTLAATLVARQEIARQARQSGVSDIDQLASRADNEVMRSVKDAIRTRGWRVTAASIRTRSIAASLPLVVRYSDEVMNQEELAARAPVLRRIYNEISPARAAVDRIATLLSQGMKTIGFGSEATAAFGRDLLDLQLSRTYLAHVARDAFVCGNGYLSFGDMPDEDIRLLPPEHVLLLDENTARLVTADEDSVHRKILHVRGAEQVGNIYGVSVLEPFVHTQCMREAMRYALDFADAYDRPEYPNDQRALSRKNIALAERVLAKTDEEFPSLLGAPGSLKVEVPRQLYFPGYENMQPAATGLTLGDAE
jgi:SpoU rRNA methylase family enzyme